MGTRCFLTTASIKLEASSLQAFGGIVTAKRSSHFLAPQVSVKALKSNASFGGCHGLSSELSAGEDDPGACRPHSIRNITEHKACWKTHLLRENRLGHVKQNPKP